MDTDGQPEARSEKLVDEAQRPSGVPDAVGGQTCMHEWSTATGGMMCYYCGRMWWANTPEPGAGSDAAMKEQP